MFGSHDRPCGETFCELDYEVWSASVENLGGWQGKHGYEGPISVAASNTPAGKYEYLGFVQNPDGTPFREKITFDPGVINDARMC